MLDWLLNPLFWTVIGTPATFLATWFAYRQFSQSKRDIRCELVGAVALVSVTKSMRDVIDNPHSPIRVTVYGKEVHDITAVLMRLSNTGRAAISPADYEQPLRVTFGKEAEVLACRIAQKQPSYLHADIAFEDNSVIVTPGLLNAGNSIEFVAWVTRYSAFQPTAHISGIPPLSPARRRERRTQRLYVISALFGLYYATGLCIILVLLAALKLQLPDVQWWGPVACGLLHTIAWMGIISPRLGFKLSVQMNMKLNLLVWLGSTLLFGAVLHLMLDAIVPVK